MVCILVGQTAGPSCTAGRGRIQNDFNNTNLDDALGIRDTMKMVDY